MAVPQAAARYVNIHSTESEGNPNVVGHHSNYHGRNSGPNV
jgi:hypothetical protein